MQALFLAIGDDTDIVSLMKPCLTYIEAAHKSLGVGENMSAVTASTGVAAKGPAGKWNSLQHELKQFNQTGVEFHTAARQKRLDGWFNASRAAVTVFAANAKPDDNRVCTPKDFRPRNMPKLVLDKQLDMARLPQLLIVRPGRFALVQSVWRSAATSTSGPPPSTSGHIARLGMFRLPDRLPVEQPDWT